MVMSVGLLRKLVFALVLAGALSAPLARAATPAKADFPTPVESYADSAESDLWAKLAGRVRKDPFNAVATLLLL